MRPPPLSASTLAVVAAVALAVAACPTRETTAGSVTTGVVPTTTAPPTTSTPTTAPPTTPPATTTPASPTATATRPGSVILEDGFDDNSGDWPVDVRDGFGVIDITAGDPEVNAINVLDGPVRGGVTVIADVVQLDGDPGAVRFGVICEQFFEATYYFWITSDGGHGIEGHSTEDAVPDVEVVGEAPSPAIAGVGEPNRIAATCASGAPTRLLLTVNGERLLEATDPNAVLEEVDTVGLHALSTGSEASVGFDHIAVVAAGS